MTTIAARFALKNIRANRLVNIPFVISNGIMFLLYNVTAVQSICSDQA